MQGELFYHLYILTNHNIPLEKRGSEGIKTKLIIEMLIMILDHSFSAFDSDLFLARLKHIYMLDEDFCFYFPTHWN